MNKKILIFTLLFFLFSISFVSARMCDSQQVLDVLRKALYIYYTSPESSSFTPEELKDLLGFYVGIQSGQITVDCTEQENNIDRANALPDTIPSCSDGTKYGKCNLNNKPTYCYAGRLVPRCRLCGCPTGQWCDITYVYTEKVNKGQWGKCNPGTDVACVVDSDCGTSTFVYHCSDDDDILRDYTKYICLNPGETYSSCTTETTTELIQDCKILGRECVEGKNECRTHITCFVDSDCGTSHYEGAYYCSDDNSIFRDYTKYICLNPGETYSSCTREYTTELIEDCEATGKECVEGSSECQTVTPQNLTCSDGTPYGQCSTTKPKYCSNGTLIDNCQVCGCAVETCRADGTCSALDCWEIVQIEGGQFDPVIYGNKIAYTNREIRPPSIEDVFIYDLVTGKKRRITTNESGRAHSLDMQGNRLVWIEETGVRYKRDVYMYDLGPDGTYGTGDEGEGTYRITTTSENIYTPKIYGDKIVWSSLKYGDWDILMYDISTGQETRLTTSPDHQLDSAIWENKVVWRGASGIYDVSTGQITPIATSIGSDPEIYNNIIVSQKNWDVYMYDISTGKETSLAPFQLYSQDYPVIWGDKIVWMDGRSYGKGYVEWYLYMYKISNGESTQLPVPEGHAGPIDIYEDKIVWADLGIWMMKLC